MSDDIKRVLRLNDNRTQEERDDAAWLAHQAMAQPGFVPLEGMQLLYRTIASQEDDRPWDGPWRVHRPDGDIDGRWREGDRWFPTGDGCTEAVFDPDDFATAGLLLYLLGPRITIERVGSRFRVEAGCGGREEPTIGRAACRIAIGCGEWPGRHYFAGRHGEWPGARFFAGRRP